MGLSETPGATSFEIGLIGNAARACLWEQARMPPAARKSSAATAQADAATVKAPSIAKAAAPAVHAVKAVLTAKNSALAAVAAAMAATAAGEVPLKVAAANTAVAENEEKPKRWIVKKTLSKFQKNLNSVPDYYLPKFIQLVAAEIAPRCDGDQTLSRWASASALVISFLMLTSVLCLIITSDT